MLELLPKAIDEVLELESFREQHPLERAVHGAYWKDSEQGNNLLAILSVTELAEFHEHFQMLGSGGTVVTRNDLANWCVDRAIVVGAEQVRTEIEVYLNSEEVEVYEILLLASVYIDSEYEFTNGAKLLHIGSIPNSWLAQRLVNADSSILPLPSVNSVILIPFTQRRFHWSSAGDERIEPPWPSSPIQDLLNTRRALVLARPPRYGIHSIGHGSFAAESSPFIRPLGGWAVRATKQPPLAPPVLELEARNADELLKQYTQLPDEMGAKLDISIDRLNGYASGADIVDRAIDLRICLESIFLNDGNKEQLRQTLALRAARFLGENLDERKTISSTIKKGYDLTSHMVHSGKSPKKGLEILDEVAAIAKKAIHRLLKEREIDWQKVELGDV